MSARDAIAEVFRLQHQNVCYPNASSGECLIAADAIIAAYLQAVGPEQAVAAKPAVKDDETVEALLDERQKRAEQVHDRILAARDGIRVNLSPDSPEWLRDAFNKLHEAHHIMGGDPFDMHMRAALAAKDGRFEPLPAAPQQGGE